MPSKNSINRPKNKNTARAKAQHKASVSRRTPQTAIIHGKVDSKKVMQKKVRRARLAAGIESAMENGDVVMADGEEEAADRALDTRVKKEERKAAILKEQQEKNEQKSIKEFQTHPISSSRGTTLGGPPSK